MDTAVALVEAYLRVNGYFTISEYPVLEAGRRGTRTVTDLDVLAFRFAGAGHALVRPRRDQGLAELAFTVDPALHCPLDSPDMLVGEVKEGAARFNPATRNPAVLERAYLHAHRHVLLPAQLHDPALALLSLFEKWNSS